MLYAIRFRDDSAADPAIRSGHMEAHLAFLEDNAGAIHAAGPLAEEDGSVEGGLWLIEVADIDAAWKLVRANPFWPTGLRDAVDIREWRQVFADGERLTTPVSGK